MSDLLNYEHYPFDPRKLPCGWAVTSINSLATEIESGFPSGEHNEEGRGVPHLRPMNIDRQGRIDLTKLKFVDIPSPKTVRYGDVLFNNTNSSELIGKTSVINSEAQLAFSNHMTRIEVNGNADPRFVAAQLHFLWMTGYFKHRCVNHVNQASISTDPLSNTVPLLIAPINEQQGIADALDELLSDLDAGVEALRRAQAKLALYRASVLKAAVQGDLTAEWRKQHPDAEPASVLLGRILAERRQRWEQEQLRKFKAAGKTPPANWKAKYKEPVAPVTTNLPPIPEGWCWASFGQIAWLIRSGVSATSGRQATNHPVLKSSAVRPNSIDFEDVNFLPDSESASGEHFLQLRDLLITRLSGSLSYVANCAVVQKLPNIQMQYPDRIFCAKVIDSIDPQFISACFQHQSFRKHFENAAKSTAGHQRISLTDLVAFLFPLPPLAEQFSIIEMLDENLSGVDHLLIEARQGEESLNALRQSILRHAFTGQLVPQDPNDEPASELLKRIAAERQARKKTKAAPRKQTAKRQKREK